jgi:C-terminal processing protease CtpA/Prc
MSAEAKAYLDRAITAFREQHINASKMDWPSLTQQAYAAAAGAKTTADTYPAIRLIIAALGEKHTFLVEPDAANAQKTGKVVGSAPPPPLQLPEVVRLANGIGVVRMHSFLGSREQAQLYSSTGESKIKELQRAGVCKFVLDLSSDKGGNMYPMLQAVSGLLNEGVLGTFENARGQFWPWVLKNGTVTEGGLINSPSVRKAAGQGSSPIAVILGRSTASAGEFTAMSFEGRPDTRFFGAPTAGYVTANQPITLSDGAVIVMTSGWGLDRRGKKYVDSIQPDVNTGSGAAALNAAVTWLSNEHCERQTRRTAS